MARLKKDLVIRCAQRLLRPLVRFALRHSLRVQEFVECIKVAYVEAAGAVIEAEGEQVTDSRLSVMTGIHRRDIKRLVSNQLKFDTQQSLVMKVIGLWQTDPNFRTSAGKPKVLSFGKEQSDFYNLVWRVSKDVNPATILFELERLGAVEKTVRGLRLLTDTYTPADNFEGAFQLLEGDISHLLVAVEENSLGNLETLNLHARTEYDNVRAEELPEIRRWLVEEGHNLHRRARNFFASKDQDITPVSGFKGKKGVKVVLGTFSKVYEPES